MKRNKRILSFIIALALTFSLSVPAWAAEEKEERRQLHISTAEELKKLSRDCAVDSYSEGLTVYLDADIDLKDQAFYPIPSFNGIFEGRNHSISNMKTVTSGSHQGFFRYVQPNGIVKDLKVEGTVMPSGSRNQLGGIAGINYGSIEGCSFSGSVKGLNHVGGIAGENNGSIVSCTSQGSVDGKQGTGGIAGRNSGTIRDCSSNSRVNTVISNEKPQLDELSLADVTNLDLKSAGDEDTVTDSGGIAGYSTGIIENCSSRGTVGYRHYGYNVGGIAGRQSGYINNCINYADVYGRKDVGGIAGQMEPFMTLIDAVNLAGELNVLQGIVAGTAGNVQDASEQIYDAIQNSGSLIPGLGGIIGGDSGIFDDDSGISPGEPQPDGSWVPDYSQSMGDSTGAIANGVVGATGQLSKIILILANILSGEDRTVIEDISEELPEDDTDGRITVCTNCGSIDGDRNVGGIAGEMGIEYDFDLEGTLSEFFSISGMLSATYESKCVNINNINNGSISGKKDNVGGICGMEDIGLIKSCEGYGRVESLEGGCVGGIAGFSNTAVRDSYSMCNIKGGANVGGIVGYGTEISGCGSLVGIEDTTVACCGTIAGWADINAGGSVSNNKYVHESIGAVDGISYTGQAEGMSYESFLQTEGLPEKFRQLKISYVADGKTVKELEFTYGGSIDESQIPQVPEKEGYSGVWPEYDYSQLYFSDTVEAVYTLRQAAMASDNLRGDSPMSVILLEGDFNDGAYINLSPYSGDAPEPAETDFLEIWDMSISDPGDEEIGSYTIRFAPPETEDGVDIYVLKDGRWTEVNTGKNGSYVTFEAQGREVIFAAARADASESTVMIIIIAAAAVLAVIIAVTVIRKKKKSAALKAEPDAEENTAGEETAETDKDSAEEKAAEDGAEKE